MRLARLVVLGATVLGLVALRVPAVSAQQTVHNHAAAGTQDLDPNSPLVRAVQDATRTFGTPQDAPGYERFLGCVSGGGSAGAMGVHFVNGALVADGVIDASKPEALMYEWRNGRWNLLGVEFIVDVAQWHSVHKSPTDVPVLMGQVFTYNAKPNRYGLEPFYALHVWAWRENRDGTFVDWNKDVVCDQTPLAP
jgi:hypothetical protein